MSKDKSKRGERNTTDQYSIEEIGQLNDWLHDHVVECQEAPFPTYCMAFVMGDALRFIHNTEGLEGARRALDCLNDLLGGDASCAAPETEHSTEA